MSKLSQQNLSILMGSHLSSRAAFPGASEGAAHPALAQPAGATGSREEGRREGGRVSPRGLGKAEGHGAAEYFPCTHWQAACESEPNRKQEKTTRAREIPAGPHARV